MKKSIFIKIFGVYFVLTTALCGLFIFFSYLIIRSSHIDTKGAVLTDLAQALQGDITPMVMAGNYSKLDGHVKDLGKTVQARITIITPKGIVLADSVEKPARMENHGTRVEVLQAMAGVRGTATRFSATLRQEMLYVAIPVMQGGKIIYTLRVSSSLKEITSVTNNLVEKIIVIAFIIDMLALICAFLFSRSISLPLKELSSALQKAVGFNFHTRVFFKRTDEINDLAESFNGMLDQTEELFLELSRQKEELQSIMASLKEGLIVLDRDDKAIFANDSLKTITGVDLVQEKPYWEQLRMPKLSEIVKTVRSTKENYVLEIEIEDSIFLCSATFLPSREEITVIFNDITQMKQLEKIKTDFVLNVSHELRTPLTSIKGFLETMETTGLSEENRHYVGIIKRNTDRLINIVTDLLTLSGLEGKQANPPMEPINLKELISHVLKTFEQAIEAKGLTTGLSIETNLPPVKGDPFRLEQVFVNLLDNAVKYTESGGIFLEAKKQGGSIITTITDTGAGIQPEHLPRIFERFYVADKSRSKKLGGTGLGLSIVKHVLLLHKGTINVESTPGKGTKCIVTLPVYRETAVNPSSLMEG